MKHQITSLLILVAACHQSTDGNNLRTNTEPEPTPAKPKPSVVVNVVPPSDMDLITDSPGLKVADHLVVTHFTTVGNEKIISPIKYVDYDGNAKVASGQVVEWGNLLQVLKTSAPIYAPTAGFSMNRVENGDPVYEDGEEKPAGIVHKDDTLVGSSTNIKCFTVIYDRGFFDYGEPVFDRDGNVIGIAVGHDEDYHYLPSGYGHWETYVVPVSGILPLIERRAKP